MTRPSKARREQGQNQPPPAEVPVTPPEALSVLRRLLLVLLTTLIVSRPLLRGESFGLVSDLSDAGGLVWTFLGLVGCAAWAFWRVFTRRHEVYGGTAELALLALTGLIFAGAAWSSYVRAALLSGWEWVGLLVLLFLTRQLSISERERQGTFCVLLATGVALSVTALYQAAWELPRHRVAAEQEDLSAYVRGQFQQRLERPSDAEVDLLTRRLEGNRPSGPFLYPASLAGALVLLVPGLILSALAAYRYGAQVWQIALVASAALLALTALVLTREWLFVVALLVGCALVLPQARLALLGLALVGAGALYGTGQLTDELSRRADAWKAAMGVINEGRHMWFGVGPAQSPFWMPRFLSESAGTVQGPDSLLLQLWAENGLIAVLLSALLVGLIVGPVYRWWNTTAPVERETLQAPEENLPWELYLGGTLGILLAFVVRAVQLTPEDLFPAALQAALGAMAWFAALAAFEQLPWTMADRMTALQAGAVGLLLALLLSPGGSAPALLGLLLVVVGLMLAQARPEPVSWLGQGGVTMNFPMSVFVAGALGYLVFVVFPTLSTALAHRQARLSERVYYEDLQKPRHDRRIGNPVGFIEESVLKPLHQAEQAENRVVLTYQLMAEWYASAWALAPLEPGNFPRSAKAVSAAGLAHLANLETPEGLVIQARIRLALGEGYHGVADRRERVADNKDVKKEDRDRTLALAAKLRESGKEQFGHGATALEGAIRRDPTNPKHWALLAHFYHRMGEADSCRKAALEAARLDDVVRRARRLPDRERQLVDEWKNSEPKK